MIRRTEPANAALRILRQGIVSGPPVDIDAITRTVGIDVLYTELPEEVSGILYVENDTDSKIMVNRSHHENRQRFTLAHELGHYILHKDNKGIHIDKKSFSRNEISQTGLDPIEIEANRFAAELLMPKEFVEREMVGYEDLVDIDEDIILNLAQKFHVSTAAMSIRLQSLGYLPREF